ncbi:MAG: hypothetical protein NZZ41_02925 [Candidatus Dojkabacteria bacterium]|nr:hypothetical protein [Candidatus Dojkabacteria bacterium]
MTKTIEKKILPGSNTNLYYYVIKETSVKEIVTPIIVCKNKGIKFPSTFQTEQEKKQ